MYRILPMKRRDLIACNKITAASEPWKTLNEGIDFARYIKLRQAYVCMIKEKPIGFVIFTSEPVFARGGYLRAIGVSPTMQGQGIGRALMTFAEKMTACRAPNLYLCVSSFNRPAQAFYKSLGYVKCGRVPNLILPGKSEYIYRKQLSPLRST